MKQALKVASFGLAWAVIVSLSSLQKCHAQSFEGGAIRQSDETAQALPGGQSEPSSFWINFGGFSKHFQDNGRNETNLGLGVEYRFRDDMSVMAGYHENSLSLRTKYAAVNYQPLEIGPLKVGASIGVMSGYPQMRNGGGFFAALPLVTWEGERFGLNFGVIPNIPSKHVEGAFVVQLKVRAF